MCSSQQQQLQRMRMRSPALAQEIFDEFLLCRICFDAFNGPKSLSCRHVFCCRCIDAQFNARCSSSSYRHQQQQQQLCADRREFTCPLCYKRTPLPPGGATMLPEDLAVSRLLALVARECQEACQAPPPSCGICMTVNHQRRSDQAVSRCIECSKLLCGDCDAEHRRTKVTSGHALFGIEVQEKDIECKDHAQETVRFYCVECDVCVCVVCTFDQTTHGDHSLVPLDEAVCSVRRRLQTTLNASRAKADDCDARIEAIGRCEQAVATTTQTIRETADRLTREVGEAQVRLTEQLRRSVGPEAMQRLEAKKRLEAVVEGMRSTCDIAEVIVSGKEDVELLLLKRDVEGKLRSCIDAIQSSSSLPLHQMKSFADRIQFTPGSVTVGRLHDDNGGMTSPMECSGSTKNRTLFRCQHPPGAKATTRETAAQTDEETDKKTDERGGRGGGGGVRPTLPVMTVSVRASPPKMKADQKDEERRRRRRRDTSQTKVSQSLRRNDDDDDDIGSKAAIDALKSK